MQEPVDPTLSDEAASVSEADVETLILELRGAQNFPLAVVSGCVAGVVSAILWAVISVSTGYQVGWVAIGVGFLVGFAIKYTGKGVEKRFGILGAITAGAAVFVGQVLMVYGFLAQEAEVGFFAVFGEVSLDDAVAILKQSMNGIDLLFYGIAIWEGYKLSFQELDESAMRSAARRTRRDRGD